MPYKAVLGKISDILEENTTLFTDQCRNLLMDSDSSEVTLYDFEMLESFDMNVNPHTITISSSGRLEAKVDYRPFLVGCENPLQKCSTALTDLPEQDSDEREEFFSDFEDLLFNWFSGCWNSSGAPEIGLKGFLRFGKDSAWFDLQEKIWTDEDEILQSLGLDPAKKEGTAILG